VPPSVAIIINPVSGGGGRPDLVRTRAEQAVSLARSRRADPHVFVTERSGHARELALAAVDRGITTVIAWGGDGTVNEVASALAFRHATLGIIPSGSGNGLARELQIPVDPARAFAGVFSGRTGLIDAGELDGRLFFNVAGIGLDARVAHLFAAGGPSRRGLRRYLMVAARELWSYRSGSYTVITDDSTVRVEALIIALANGRQYGNGARIAPAAALDDGLLDVVVVAARSPLAILRQVPRLFTGRIDGARGVTSVKAAEIEVTSDHPLPYHVDGEPFTGGPTVQGRARPGALRVALPADAPADVLRTG